VTGTRCSTTQTALDLCLQQANPGPDKLYVLACICAHILDAYRNQ